MDALCADLQITGTGLPAIKPGACRGRAAGRLAETRRRQTRGAGSLAAAIAVGGASGPASIGPAPRTLAAYSSGAPGTGNPTGMPRAAGRHAATWPPQRERHRTGRSRLHVRARPVSRCPGGIRARSIAACRPGPSGSGTAGTAPATAGADVGSRAPGGGGEIASCRPCSAEDDHRDLGGQYPADRLGEAGDEFGAGRRVRHDRGEQLALPVTRGLHAGLRVPPARRPRPVRPGTQRWPRRRG